MPKKPKRVVIYARVSTAEQTTENQLQELRAVATRHGWVVVEEFVDDGVSGARASHPAFDRFLKAVNKAIEMKQAWEIVDRNKSDMNKVESDYLTIKSDKRIYKIAIDDLYFIQSYGDYVKIHTRDKVIIAAETMKNMEKYLVPHCVRIHKSYLVIKKAIKYVEGNQVNVHETMLPIGQKYREDFFKILKNR